jgi:hypothetical protein
VNRRREEGREIRRDGILRSWLLEEGGGGHGWVLGGELMEAEGRRATR